MRALLGLDDADGITVNDSTALRVSTVYACPGAAWLAQCCSPHSPVRDRRQAATASAPLALLWWLLNESPHELDRCQLEGMDHALRGAARRPAHRDPARPGRGQFAACSRCIRPRGAAALSTGGWSIECSTPSARALHGGARGHAAFLWLRLQRRALAERHHWAARRAVRNAIVSSDHARESLANGAVQKLALYPNKINQGQLRLLRESWSETYGGAKKSGRPIVLTEGGQIKELSLSASDLQLIEGRKFEREEICQTFGVPPVLIGDTEKASSWEPASSRSRWASSTSRSKPHLVRWEEELNRKLFKRAGQFVELSSTACCAATRRRRQTPSESLWAGPARAMPT